MALNALVDLFLPQSQKSVGLKGLSDRRVHDDNQQRTIPHTNPVQPPRTQSLP